jgi:hypothetical protein
MPSAAGPIASAKQNLVFAIDTHDMPNGATLLGCGGFNGSTQGVKDLISGNLYTFENGMKLTNRTYYTAAGISYPEGNYGGDAANAHGLYLGYNVRGGTNVYGASRSLHLWVWNNQTNSWISGYFNGARIGGHCYDNYAGAENGWQNEMAKFVADYNTVKNLFPDCTYIIVGSHACQSFRQEDIDTLISLGAPSYIQDWTDNASWREFVLVGKPGLGAGNAYGWAHENYPTNPVQVAHINFGLPIKTRGGMEFDGTNDYIGAGTIQPFTLSNRSATWEAVVKFGTSSGSNAIATKWSNSVGQIWWFGRYPSTKIHIAMMIGGGYYPYYSDGDISSTSNYYHIVVTLNGTLLSYYINGVLDSTDTVTAGTWASDNGQPDLIIGAQNEGNAANFNGEIPIVKLYNTALTTSEVQQNYQQYKTRFNLS